MSRILARLKPAQRLWAFLGKVLLKAASNHETLYLSFVSDPLLGGSSPEGRYRILEAELPRLTLRPAGSAGGKEVRSVFDLSTPALFSLLNGVKDLTSSEARLGLGLLLLVRCGPNRGIPFLLSGEKGSPGVAFEPQELARIAEIALNVQLKETQSLFEKYRKAAAPPEVWDYLSRKAAGLAVNRRLGKEAEETVREIYLGSRTESLCKRPIERFFHAKRVKKLGGGRLGLSYDFSGEEQLQDFAAVPERAYLSRFCSNGRSAWQAPMSAGLGKSAGQEPHSTLFFYRRPQREEPRMEYSRTPGPGKQRAGLLKA